MHIQEGTNTTLTTCTKMTEEVDRRHGVNGNSSKGASEDAPVHNTGLTASGGRLKFFKDGKFILELVRGAGREGERSGWVSVPRKTFWPPAAAPPTPPAPPPPAASLSASDDNSSLQSSPWQRDHCWKQAAPRRNLSKELAVYYCRPSTLHTSLIAAAARRKRRRPYDTALLEPAAAAAAAPAPAPASAPANGLCDKKRNGDADTAPIDAAEGDEWADFDREKYYHMKLKKPYQYHKLRVYTKTRPVLRRKELTRTIEKLRERIASLPVPVNAKLANCRQEHAIVSPRKRILRELERVSLEDQGMKRRAKTVPALSTTSYPPSPGPSHAPKPPAEAPPRPHNGTGARKDPPLTKNASSYSIHSLLSMPEASPPRRSPHAPPPKTDSPCSHSPDPSPSPDAYRYRPAADSPTPPELSRYRGAGAGAGAYAGAAPPYARWAAAAGQYRGAGAAAPRDDWPYVYGYPYAAPLFPRAPPPLWMHYAVAPGAPPGPWAPLPHPLLADHIPKEEPTSDLPLNLSKH